MVSRNQSTPLIGDLPQLRAFLVTKLNSFIKWDVVNFTQENSGVTDLKSYALRRSSQPCPTRSRQVATGVLIRQRAA